MELSGPGKTAPRLQEDILQYDPRKEVDRGYNVLTEPPPPFDGSNTTSTPKGSCRHTLFIKYPQSRLPETFEPLAVAGKYKIAAYCQKCRYHVDIVVDFSAAGPQSRCCPNDDFPLHHFVPLEDGQVPSHNRSSLQQRRLEFHCSAASCALKLAIQYRPPRLGAEDIRLLTNPTLLKTRSERAMRLRPDRPFKEKKPLDVLDILRTYLKDALNPESSKTRIPMQNAAFMAVFGDDCHPLLERLGFRASPEGDGQGFWYLPKVTATTDPLGEDNLRRLLEDVIEELAAVISRAPESEDKRNLKTSFDSSPVPAAQEIGRCLSTLEYPKSPTARPTTDSNSVAHPYYAGLGTVADFADDLLLFAYNRQSECDPVNGPYYFECLQGLAKGRGSESLQTQAAVLASQGHITRQDVADAFQFFALDPSHNLHLTDGIIIGKYQSRLPDLGKGQERDAREKLRIIGRARGSPAIMQAASEEIETYEQALAWLGVDPGISDEFVTTFFTVRTDESAANAELGRKAIQIIADHRNSDYLRTWLQSSGGGVDTAAEKAQAFSTLEITQEDGGIDSETLQVLLSTRIEEAPDREGDFRRAAEVIQRHQQNATPGENSSSAMRAARDPGQWPVGLRNIGNTCYLNSLLQYCFTVRTLRDIVLDYKEYMTEVTDASMKNKKVGGRQVSRKEVERAQRFVEQLAKLFKSMIVTADAVVRPDTKVAHLTLVNPREDGWRLKSPTSPARRATLGEIDGRAVIGPLGPPVLPKQETETSTIRDDASDDTLIDDEDANQSRPDKMDGIVRPASNADAPSSPSGKRKRGGADRGSQQDDDSVMESIENANSDVNALSSPNRRDSMEVNEDNRTRSTEGLPPDHDTNKPSHPSRPPPVPPRIQPDAAAADELEEASWAANQQDVTEAIDNVFFQLRCAIKAEGFDAKHGEQIDCLKNSFYGSVQNIKLDSKDPEPTKEELFRNLFVNVADGPRKIYSALDEQFDLQSVEIDGKMVQRYALITELPPFLQINVQRVGYNRQTNSTFKIEHKLELEEIIYLDRYLWTDDRTTNAKRKECWRLKDALRRLESREKELVDTEAGMTLVEAVDSVSKHVADLGHAADTDRSLSRTLPENSREAPSLVDDLKEESAVLQAELQDIRERKGIIDRKLEALFADHQSHGYRLYALFIHRGDASAQGGHYWIYIKDFEKDVWRKYNDEDVTEVDRSEIFEQAETRPATPYFIVYVRDNEKTELTGPLLRIIDVEETNTDAMQVEDVGGIDVIEGIEPPGEQ